eukprot:scaffold46618_cov34-Phaeocystis_antarctica.AAC.1
MGHGHGHGVAGRGAWGCRVWQVGSQGVARAGRGASRRGPCMPAARAATLGIHAATLGAHRVCEDGVCRLAVGELTRGDN